jgi:hypothetical protein
MLYSAGRIHSQPARIKKWADKMANSKQNRVDLIAGGTFEHDLRRTESGWRIYHIVLNSFFNNDPTGKLAELFPGPSL